MSWRFSLAVAIVASCCCNRSANAVRVSGEDSDVHSSVSEVLRWKFPVLKWLGHGAGNLMKGALGEMEGEANNLVDAEALGEGVGHGLNAGLDADALGADLGRAAMESAAPGLENAAANAGAGAVESALQQLVGDPNTQLLVGQNAEHGVTSAINALVSNPNLQPMVTETTANAVGTALDTLVGHEVGQYAVWAVSGVALLSVMNLGVNVMTLREIKKGFERLEKAINRLEATIEKGLSRIYNKLDEIKDVLQLQFLNDATAQIKMSWRSMMYCLKNENLCKSKADFDGFATVEKRHKIAMGLQELDRAIRGQPDELKITKVDLMVRIINLALGRTPRLNHQQVRAAAWNYWGELMVLQVKGTAVLEYMSKSEGLQSDLWGTDRLQADLYERLDLQRERIKEIFDSMEVEGYYLRSKQAQSCLMPGWLTSTLQYTGNCTVPNQPEMSFNVVPMQAVHLPFQPGQAVEYITKNNLTLQGVIANVQKDFAEKDLLAGIPAEGLLDIVYPDGGYLKVGAFFNRTRQVWPKRVDHQFFLRHKVSKTCLTINMLRKISTGYLELSDNLTNIEGDANINDHLFHMSPADLDGSFYLDYVDPADDGKLKCVRPGWSTPNKLTGLGSYKYNVVKIAHKPCQNKSNPYPTLAFDMVFSVQEVPAKASMSLPWSSLRPRDNDE